MEGSQQVDRQGTQRAGGPQVDHWDSRAGQSRAGSRGMSHRGREGRSHREQGGRGAVSGKAGRGERVCPRDERAERARQLAGAGGRGLVRAYEEAPEYLQEERRGLGGRRWAWRRGEGDRQRGAWRRWS